MDLIKDLRQLLLNFNSVMIYIIHKILVLIKNHLNYLKDNLFECFSRSIIDFYVFKKLIFFITYNDGNAYLLYYYKLNPNHYVEY